MIWINISTKNKHLWEPITQWPALRYWDDQSDNEPYLKVGIKPLLWRVRQGNQKKRWQLSNVPFLVKHQARVTLHTVMGEFSHRPPTKDPYHFVKGRERWERGILGVETYWVRWEKNASAKTPSKEVGVLAATCFRDLHCRDSPQVWCREGSFQHEAIHSLVMAWPRRSQIGTDLLELDSLISGSFRIEWEAKVTPSGPLWVTLRGCSHADWYEGHYLSHSKSND